MPDMSRYLDLPGAACTRKGSTCSRHRVDQPPPRRPSRRFMNATGYTKAHRESMRNFRAPPTCSQLRGPRQQRQLLDTFVLFLPLPIGDRERGGKGREKMKGGLSASEGTVARSPALKNLSTRNHECLLATTAKCVPVAPE